MPHISRRFSALFLFILFSAATMVNAQDKAASIDEMMKRHNQYGHFNGSVLVAENGRVIYKKGFGMANMEWNIPNDPETKFRLASITKQFTAALILQLVEQGKLKLDGKLTDYLPDYRKDTGDRITVHQLLNQPDSGNAGLVELHAIRHAGLRQPPERHNPKAVVPAQIVANTGD